MKMPIILYIVSTLSRTGPTQQLLYIIKHIDRSQFQPQILTLSPEPQNSMLSDFQDLDIPMQSLNISRLTSLFWGKNHLNKAIQEINPALIHTQGIRADSLALGLIDKLPIVTTARNDPYADYLTVFGKVKGSLMAWSHVRTLRRLPQVVACGTSLSQDLAKYHISTHIISNGVDTDSFSPVRSNQERASLRQTLGLTPSSIVFVTVGSLIPRKDPLLIIDAFCRARLQNAVLVILGTGSLEEACKQASLKASPTLEIRLQGQVSDVRPWLCCANALISAAWSEGLPNSVLQGMSCGLPVLLSDIPPHQEIIEKTSASSGKLFPPGNIEELSNLLESFSSYLFGLNICRQTMIQFFSAKAMASAYQSLYEKILMDN
jgi:glycosyltransferase involved in cell wall biosynthesis